MTDYEFSVVSQDKHHEGDVFKQFTVGEEIAIGVEEKEPFELRFRNNTNKRVQVRFSVDGTDVLTGQLASTKPTGQMFLVAPNNSLSLKAWPETLQGGARFVFTTAEKSVAVNTHGNTSGIGLIAAAVYVDYNEFRYGQVWGTQSISVNNGGRFLRSNYSGGLLGARGMSSNLGSNTKAIYNVNANGGNEMFDSAAALPDANLAVGAGEYTDQTLVKSAGLSRPVLDDIIQVRYLPWAKLQKLIAS